MQTAPAPAEPRAPIASTRALPDSAGAGEAHKVNGLARRLYGPRILGSALGALAVGAALVQRDAPVSLWLVLFANAALWPHVAYRVAIRSPRPDYAERRNLLMDSFAGGFWIPAMHFNLLPSVLALAMFNMDNAASGGRRLFLQGMVAQGAGALVALALVGFHAHLATDLPTLLACVPALLAFPLLTGLISHRFSGRLAKQKHEIETSLQAIAERERLFRALVSMSSQAVWHLRSNGRDVQRLDLGFAAWWSHFTGRTHAQGVGEDGSGWLDVVHPDDRSTAAAVVHRLRAGTQTVESEYRVRRHDGEWRWLALTGRRLHEVREPEMEWVGLVVDVTEKKAVEAELQQHHRNLEALIDARTRELHLAKDEAERSAGAKARFLANMSHEIRTPMNGVLGMAQLGHHNAAFPPLARDYFAKIVRSGKLMLRVVDDVLDYSKIEANKLLIEAIATDPVQVVESVVELMQESAASKGLRLNVHVGGVPARTLCLCDPIRLQQILLNLASNAVKFTPQGSVTLSASVTTGRLCFQVIDTGIGMRADELERVFQAFEQADKSTTRRYGGTGLGLAIVHKLVTLMGGDIRVESNVGVGTRFDVALPFVAASPAPAIAAPEQSVGGALAGIRVLLAEDNAVNRMVMETMLTLEGAQVSTADDGVAAVQALRHAGAGAFDIVLMDLQMPRLDGFEATRLIRELAPSLPVLAQSADVLSEDVARCEEAGMAARLCKPVAVEDLISAVRKFARPSPSVTQPAQGRGE